MVIVSSCFDFYGVTPQGSVIAPQLSWVYMYHWLESA